MIPGGSRYRRSSAHIHGAQATAFIAICEGIRDTTIPDAGLAIEAAPEGRCSDWDADRAAGRAEDRAWRQLP